MACLLPQRPQEGSLIVYPWDWLVCFYFFRLSPEQKEAVKVKSESNENGGDEMEVENGDKEVASEEKA